MTESPAPCNRVRKRGVLVLPCGRTQALRNPMDEITNTLQTAPQGKSGQWAWRAGVIFFSLGALLLATKLWYGSRQIPAACDGILICDAQAFAKACEAARNEPDPHSAIAVLGRPAEERCDETAGACEIEILGGPGPRHDGCIVRYEKGSGKILETRHYAW